MTGWTGRVRSVPGPRELENLRDAAQDIAEQAGRTPAQERNAFQRVYNVALLATVVLSGALAGIHLYKTLFPKPRDHRHQRSPEPVGDARVPPHHHHLVKAIGDDAVERPRSR